MIVIEVAELEIVRKGKTEIESRLHRQKHFRDCAALHRGSGKNLRSLENALNKYKEKID